MPVADVDPVGHREESTLADAVVELGPALAGMCGESWILSIPGLPAVPTQMWLHPSGNADRGSVGISEASIAIGQELVLVPKRRGLVSLCASVVQHARAQRTSYQRNVAFSKISEDAAADLAARLGTGTRPRFGATYATTAEIELTEGTRVVARVSTKDGDAWVDAGLPDELGWHGRIAKAATEVPALRTAIETMKQSGTYDTLVYGNYRVVASREGLVAGEVVTYSGPLDNHAPHVFTRPNGQEVLIEEHTLRTIAHRILAPL